MTTRLRTPEHLFTCSPSLLPPFVHPYHPTPFHPYIFLRFILLSSCYSFPPSLLSFFFVSLLSMADTFPLFHLFYVLFLLLLLLFLPSLFPFFSSLYEYHFFLPLYHALTSFSYSTFFLLLLLLLLPPSLPSSLLFHSFSSLQHTLTRCPLLNFFVPSSSSSSSYLPFLFTCPPLRAMDQLASRATCTLTITSYFHLSTLPSTPSLFPRLLSFAFICCYVFSFSTALPLTSPLLPYLSLYLLFLLFFFILGEYHRLINK